MLSFKLNATRTQLEELDMANAVYQHGLKVAFVEKDRMRGASLSRGCRQSKLLIHFVNVAERIKRAELFGIKESSIRWHNGTFSCGGIQ
jgi:pyruvate/2-oxoglutarate dehydrogenase complex dihydrolipoamide dehydrogenase (E3) component